MTVSLKRAIAYIAGRMIEAKGADYVFDYSDSKHYTFSGEVGEKVNIYDSGRSCYVYGKLDYIYDDNTQNYFTFKLEGDAKFSGYDYVTKAYYSGNIEKGTIYVYDEEFREYFSYAIE